MQYYSKAHLFQFQYAENVSEPQPNLFTPTLEFKIRVI